MTTKVLIAIPTGEFARRADFYDYFNALDKPEGTVATFAHGQSPAKNRNLMIRTAMEHDCTHVMFLDDDMTFPPDTIKRLLSHDKDIVGGLYLLRNYPHFPVMFDEWFADGRCKYKFLTPAVKGLVPVVNMGLGCVLIKMEVFKKMEDPWITLGQIKAEDWSDDIHFFNKARQAGFEMFVDTDLQCGHILSAVIMPRFDEATNSWMTLYNTNSPEGFQVPQVAPTIEQTKDILQKQGLA